ncbi:MAG TPA: molybdopterin converting factor subunit 1 [Anaerolineales bacterium]|nr:molybdopterin converting factor subunit 1 [Anaerolineales bacterium]
MNRIRVLFFATLRDRAGVKSVELETPADMTVRALKDRLVGDYPNLKESMNTVLVSVNKEFALDEAVIPQDAEIALFPPVSGG